MSKYRKPVSFIRTMAVFIVGFVVMMLYMAYNAKTAGGDTAFDYALRLGGIIMVISLAFLGSLFYYVWQRDTRKYAAFVSLDQACTAMDTAKVVKLERTTYGAHSGLYHMAVEIELFGYKRYFDKLSANIALDYPKNSDIPVRYNPNDPTQFIFDGCYSFWQQK